MRLALLKDIGMVATVDVFLASTIRLGKELSRNWRTVGGRLSNRVWRVLGNLESSPYVSQALFSRAQDLLRVCGLDACERLPAVSIRGRES